MPAQAQRDRQGVRDLDKLSPRVRLAARLYSTGTCKTKKEASTAAGLHPNYLTILSGPTSGSELVKRLINDVDAAIHDQSISTSQLLQRLGREAVGRIAQLMDSDNEHVALKAAVDLADRSPETSKTQKVSVESFSLDGEDVKSLAAAMVEAAKVSTTYADVGTRGLVEIEVDAVEPHTTRPSPSEERPNGNS